jgi:hypothetical protein
MKLNKDIKIKIHSEEHSAAVQKRLFELGAKGGFLGDIVINTTVANLYVEDGQLSWGNNSEYFNDCKNVLATLDDLYNPEFLDDLDGKTALIDGKRYKLVLDE